MVGVTNAEGAIEALNQAARDRITLEVRLNEEQQLFNQSLNALKSEHEPRLIRIQNLIDDKDAEIWRIIEMNRSALIAEGKKSFVTMWVVFQFRTVRSKTIVKDAVGIMKTARKLGMVRKIAALRTEWKLDTKKFLAWLDAHGEKHTYFADFIDYIEESESLTMQPNETYVTQHDSERISPPSIKINPPQTES